MNILLTPAEEAQRKEFRRMKELRHEAASSTDVELLMKLASHPELDMRCSVASNIHTPEEVLAILAKDKESRVRWQVATNRSASSSILGILSQDEMTQVRGVVANRQDTPAEILLKFAETETHRYVIACLVANPSTPLDYVLSKFDITDSYNWEPIVCNPSVPIEVLVAKYAEGTKTEGRFTEQQQRKTQLVQLKNVLISTRKTEVCEWLSTQTGAPLGDFPITWICEVLGLK